MATNDALSPELLRILKLFGVISISLVLLLSFFNERRADNTGEMGEFYTTAANRIYFRNLRQPNYDVERRLDAKMDVFRYGKRISDSTQNVLNAAIILNRIKDAAYIYIEPQGDLSDENPLHIRWESASGQHGDATFYQGDRFSHLAFLEQVFPLLVLEEPVAFEAKLGNQWIPLLTSIEEVDALRITLKDYFRLIGKEDGMP